MTLTAHQLEHYRTQGWVAPIDIMTPSEAAGLAQELVRDEKVRML